MRAEIETIYKNCLMSQGEELITARTIFQYCISPFMVYCEAFGPEDKMDPPTRYQEMLFAQGREHEKNVIETNYPDSEELEYETQEEGFKLLLKSMSEGSKVICGLPVFYLPEGLMGIFDVLERKNTKKSIFGRYHYVVKEIKLARNIQDHHIYQAAFYNYLLGKIQGYTSPVFYFYNRDSDEIEIEYDEQKLLEKITDIRKILKGKKVEPTYGACNWPWETYNNEMAIKRRDVSLVSGVGPATKQKLRKNRIKTINDLAKTSREKLLQIERIGPKIAKKLSLNSKALVSNCHICKESCEFPKKEMEIFLDLEGTSEQLQDQELIAIDYLIGVLVRNQKNVEYIPFIAHDVDKERQMFQQFIKWLSKQKNFIIYHWHHYEKVHLENLADQYEISDRMYNLLFENIRDLYKDATKCFAFPTYGNGLKDVAKYMGYRWKHADVDALESIALYLEYIDDPKGNKGSLEKILDYNEDDCRATMLVKDWMEKNFENTVSSK